MSREPSPTTNGRDLDRLFALSPDMLGVLGVDGYPKRVTPAWERTLGFTSAELLATPFLDLVHRDDLAAAAAELERLQAGRTTDFFEVRVRCKDGSYKWTQWNAAPIAREGQIYVVGRDISERKRTEALLAGQRSVLEMIATNQPLADVLDALMRLLEDQAGGMLCAVFLLDEEGQRLRCGAAPSLPPAYIRGVDGMTIGAEVTSCGAAISRRELVITTDIVTDPLWVNYRDLAAAHGLRAAWSAPIVGASGKVLGTFAMYYREARAPQPAERRLIDIATHIAGIAIQRSRAEVELRRADQRYRELVQSVPAIVWRADAQTLTFSFVSTEAEALLGYPVERWVTEPDFWRNHIHPDDREWVVTFCTTATQEKRAHEFEYRMIAADDRIVWLRDSIHVVVLDNRPLELIGVMVDITQRRQAEEEIRRYANRLKALRSIDVAILAALSPEEIAAAALTYIRDLVPCQRGAVWIFDFDAGEARALAVSGLGTNRRDLTVPLRLDAFGPVDDLREGRVQIIEDLFTQPSLPSSYQALRDEGLRSFIRAPLSAEGTLIGTLDLAADSPRALTMEHTDVAREVAAQLAVALHQARLNERLSATGQRLRTLSRQLLELQEAERRRLSRELHDEIGQALTALKLNLHALRALAEAPTSAARFDDSLAIVDQLIGQVRDLSLNLRPAHLDDLGLEAALRWYASRQAERAGLTLNFISELGERRLAPELEIACFRVAQEAVTNIVRHAHARRLSVEVRQADHGLELVVRDDGIGFDVASARERAIRGGSRGLLGMEERVYLLEGRIKIESASGKGTEIRAWLPLVADPSGRRNAQEGRR